MDNKIKKHISGELRIWIAVSIIWVIFTYIAIYYYHETIVVRKNITDWLLSTSPVWGGWGYKWIKHGLDKDKEIKNQEKTQDK